jgi:hypothetical protein
MRYSQVDQMGISLLTYIEQEEDLQIKLIARGDEFAVQIDSQITPIFCCYCNEFLKGLFQIQGSRYGQVGTVPCKCGAQIHCSDSDHIVEYIDALTEVNGRKIGKYHIDLKKEFKLNSTV